MVVWGVDEYYAGVGEAPGGWMGRWSAALEVTGMVEADALRALNDGNDPSTYRYPDIWTGTSIVAINNTVLVSRITSPVPSRRLSDDRAAGC